MTTKQTLKSGNFEIGVGNQCEVQFFSLNGEKQFDGGKSPIITLYDTVSKTLVEPDTTEYKVTHKDDHSEYQIDCFYGENKVSIWLVFSFSAGEFAIEKKKVTEGIVQLSTIDFSEIIETDSNGRMMLPAKGGRLINPDDCEAGSHEHIYNWVDDNFAMYASIYNLKACALMKLNSLNDTITSKITGNDKKRAVLGAAIRHRYTFAEPDRSVLSFKPIYNENEKKYPCEESFPAKDNSKISVYLYENKIDNLDTGWVKSAKKIYDFLPSKRTDIYKDCFVYKVFVGCYNQPIDTSFKQILDLIKDIYENTLGAKQICYIVGFQHEGHDSKYPDVFTVNKKAGTDKELLWLFNEAKKYNTILSFHDNYDDAYEDSPMWDPDDIGIDHKGHLFKGGCWNGKQAFWISLPHYSKTKSKERIKKTLEKYPIKTTYHLDVLTAAVFRLDYRSNETSCKERDLEARLNILKQFRENDIDVTSEAVGAPFIGEVSFFWHLIKRPNPVHKGDKRIPAAPFYVHGKADYSGNFSKQTDILDALLYASLYSDDLTPKTPKKDIYDGFYLVQTPLNKIRDYEAVDYLEKDGYKTVVYENNSYIKVNFESCETEVVVDGVLIVKNGTLFMEKSEGEFIAYTAFSGKFKFIPNTFDVPEKYKDFKKVTAHSIGKFEAEYMCQTKDGKLEIILPEGRPFIIKFEKAD